MATLDVNIYSLNTIEDLAEALIAQANVVQCGVVNITQLAYKLGLNVYSSVMSKTSGYIKYEGSSKNIYVNSLDSVRRQRFTIAHELGHFLLHNQLLEKQGGSVLYRNENRGILEEQANSCAAALLMPRSMVKSLFNRTSLPISEKVFELANNFNVSVEAMYVRLSILGLI